ncbi:MAG: dCTP deaminase [Chloroflexi bacterium]|nr:dCTP deaminase [Chloroflexota bacterium]MYE40983.1 dCTP deaminase [Chloroflexota bacterium]
MLLSDKDIFDAMETGALTVNPPDRYDVLVKSASIDMRLHPVIQVIRPEKIDRAIFIDPTRMANVQSQIATYAEQLELRPDQPFVMDPGVFVIGAAAEQVELSEALAARIEGKSSLARFGIQVHLTAPKIDPGWRLNNITLEIINLAQFRVALFPMMEIAALMVEPLKTPATQAYRGRFSAG